MTVDCHNTLVVEISEHKPGTLFRKSLCNNIDILNSAVGVVFRNLQVLELILVKSHFICDKFKA